MNSGYIVSAQESHAAVAMRHGLISLIKLISGWTKCGRLEDGSRRCLVEKIVLALVLFQLDIMALALQNRLSIVLGYALTSEIYKTKKRISGLQHFHLL